MKAAILPTRPNLFVEPSDLLWGPAASRAIRWHSAIPLLDDAAAAKTVTVWRPGSQQPKMEMPARELSSWLETASDTDRRRAARAIAAWRRPRHFQGVVGAGPCLMGVVNVTPDSFYPGSRRPTAEAALAEAIKAAGEGAGILDIGGQSTRPRSGPVSLSRELDAILPVIEQAAVLGVPISADTLRPDVARAAVHAGAGIINDISGLLPEVHAAGAALIIGVPHVWARGLDRWALVRHSSAWFLGFRFVDRG